MQTSDPIQSAALVRYGSPDPLPEHTPLRAGPLSLIYEAGDLRYIRLGEREIVRRIYVAVRNAGWGTVPAVLHSVELDVEQYSFRITYQAEHRQGAIDFRWRAAISGDATGMISFSMDGQAHADFQRNRIGFCVLHPAGSAGATCVVEHVDGTTETAQLPRQLRPDQPLLPFAELRAITQQLGPFTRATVRFEGDIFEMEDQRNWTDASFKTFCTPLRLPYPVDVRAGTRVRQSITLSLQAPDVLHPSTEPPAAIQFTVGSSSGRSGSEVLASAPLPSLGLEVAGRQEQLGERERELLRALHVSHLRAELRVAEPGWQQRLAQAIDQAHALDTALELALVFGADDEPALRRLRELLDAAQPRLCRCLVYPARESPRLAPPLGALLALARRYFGELGAPFGAGTNSDFFLLNLHGAPVDALDLLVFAINPQAHAFDNASLVETLEAQADVVASARRLAGNRTVAVSPVTLKPRFNPYAAAGTVAGRAPEADPRQMSLFGAAWTAGSLKYLGHSGASSVTYYETTGRRGVMDGLDTPPAADRMHAPAGAVFPLYHVLADWGEWGGSSIEATSSHPLLVDGFVLRRGEQQRIVLANLSNEPQQVRVGPLEGGAAVRMLDETNVHTAMAQPEQFRAAAGEHLSVVNGRLSLTLRPYAVARIEFGHACFSLQVEHKRTA